MDPDFRISFASPVTFFVGENGSGKSTLLEAIAAQTGFHTSGGSHDHQLYDAEAERPTLLASALRLSWLPRVKTGFLFRSETFAAMARYIDAAGDPSRHGGTGLHHQSHGEAFLALLSNRMQDGRRELLLLDEPETALSPLRQLSFLKIMHQWQRSGQVQAIIATHSPILMSLPGARILEFSDSGVRPVELMDTEHYHITRTFLENPERYLKTLLSDEGRGSVA